MTDPIVAAVARLVALHDLGDDNLGDTTPIQLRLWVDDRNGIELRPIAGEPARQLALELTT